MVAINFQSRFAPAIEAGTKIHTLRDKARCKPGDRLQLYTGQRTKQCRLLVEKTCTAVVLVSYTLHYSVNDNLVFVWRLGNRLLPVQQHQSFAQNDGFSHIDEMEKWFLENKAKDWQGHLIAWGEAEYLR
jgi:hypothetical protein